MSAEDQPELERLVALVARLRGPDGCPWDREQRLADLRAYLLEEAHETAAAIDAGDLDELANELGDLLFQIVFVAVLAEEAGGASVRQVITQVEAKMIDRHPHVFGGERLPDAAAVRRAWEERKRAEPDAPASILAGVPASLPALVAAYRLTQKAAAVGFDWSGPLAVLDKLEEEARELRQVLAAGGAEGESRAAEEIGDLFFTLVNLARHLSVDPEAAAAGSNLKFRRRFGVVERRVDLEQATLAEMETAWLEAKREEGS